MNPERIKDVRQIIRDTNQRITDERGIEEFIEFPLRAAIRIFIAKRIQTYWSTANPKYEVAAIIIDSTALSPTNIATAWSLYGYSGQKNERVEITYPITPETPVIDVEQYFVNAANTFSAQ